MQLNKSESAKQIKAHFGQLQSMNEEFGGVYIARLNGAVAVMGIENSEETIIFKTEFVSDVESTLLDAQIQIQDMLEEEGIEAISEHDFKLALTEN